ncbi:HlyD family secretion protein [Siccirubricoccus phaeus]|uniref:HlyD family secretion protein n=1 Tax=Siccirubricoccus phaeus TaxID=2595053 RepID=UPI0011F0CE2D|nr:HlyD family secretion protein [Siccirubricoccus phaeus]
MDIGQPSGIPAETAGRPARMRVMRRIVGRAAAVVVGGAILVAAGSWLMKQFTHIHVDDARIAADMVVLSSRMPGWVTAVNVAEGDSVAQGTVIIAIDERIASLDLRNVEAQLAGVAARRAETEARIVMIDHQTASQEQAQRARVEAAEAALAGAEAQFKLAQADFARAQELVATGAGTRARFDQSRAALDSGRQAVLARRADLTNARATLAEVIAAREQLNVLRRQLDTLSAEEASLTAQRERAALDLADRRIVMPFNGRVDRVFVDPGEYVTPGQRLLMVHDPDAVRVDANVKETDIRYFRPGGRVRVTVDAYPGQVLDGTVDRIGQAATSEFALLPNPNPSGNFTKISQRLPVRIRVPQQEGRLRPGMMVEVEASIRD